MDDFLLANTLDDPFLLAEWTSIGLYQPTGQAAIVEGVVALTPHNRTLVYRHWRLTLKIQF